MNRVPGAAQHAVVRCRPGTVDGVYHSTGDEALFQEARAPTGDERQGLLEKIVARLMRMLTRQGYLVEEQGMTCLADMAADHPLTPLQAAACTYRITFGARAGQKVLSLRTVASRDENATAAGLCAEAHGFSLHAAVRIGAHERARLERLGRYITRPAIANERQLSRNSDVSCGSIPGLRRSRKLSVAIVETRHSQSDQIATTTNDPLDVGLKN